MLITVAYPAWDYSMQTPFIQKVIKWSICRTPTFSTGEFIGDSNFGGIAAIEADPGDIIRVGQMKRRGYTSSDYQYYIVGLEAQLEPLSAFEAKRHYLSRVLTSSGNIDLTVVPTENLLNELKRRNEVSDEST